MKAVIELELIGDDEYELKRLIGMTGGRPWVARIVSEDQRFGFKRDFVHWQTKDYSRANSVGSRGVYAYYTLSDGIYEISERLSWKRTERYFIRVADGSYTRISKEEVKEWLKNENSGSASWRRVAAELHGY